MPRAFVIGGTGLIGRAVADRFFAPLFDYAAEDAYLAHVHRGN